MSWIFVQSTRPVTEISLRSSRALNAAACALIATIGFIALATLPPDAYLVSWKVPLFPPPSLNHHPEFVRTLAIFNSRTASIRHACHVLCNCLRLHPTSTVIPRLQHPLHCQHWACCSAQSHVRRWSWPPNRCLDLQASGCHGRV